MIRIEPNPSKGYKFLDETPAGAIPKRFLDPVNRGVRYALKAGAIAGYEIVDAKVTLCDGSYHEGDSDELQGHYGFQKDGAGSLRARSQSSNAIVFISGRLHLRSTPRSVSCRQERKAAGSTKP